MNSDDFIKRHNLKPKKIKPIGADGHRQRVILRFKNARENTFPPRDLLEILLFYPIKVRDTRDSAVLLMQKYKNDIETVINRTPAELCSVDGIGPSSALFLNIVAENVRRLKLPITRPSQTDIEKLPELFNEKCPINGDDELWAMYFDYYGKFIRAKKLNFSIDTDEGFKLFELLQRPSSTIAYIWVARYLKRHNLYPTNSDISARRKLEDYMRFSHIHFLDYYIVTPKGAFPPSNFDFSSMDLK